MRGQNKDGEFRSRTHAEEEELRSTARKALDELIATEPERYRATQEELGKVMGTICGMLSLVSAFAAPRYLAKGNADKRPTPEQLLGLFDDYLFLSENMNCADEMDNPFARTKEPTRRLRALLMRWDFSLTAPDAIVEVAREWLAAYGIPTPDEGWDRWEGPEEDEGPESRG
ncbi:hypothetical protein [Sorangium sp. So ce124]|uniref:hypothetical protein n=1 Tax=Sorangium sp. So ce124 TaxID=3133280 RepID=UPI003F6055DD